LAIYEIAYHLKIPIYKLLQEMPYDELLGWFDYFDRRPVDWRDDDRTYKYLQTQGVKEKPWKIFPTLNPIYNNNNKQEVEDGKTDMSSFKQSTLFTKLITAVNGDTIL